MVIIEILKELKSRRKCDLRFVKYELINNISALAKK